MFALQPQYEDAPTVDTLAGTLLFSAQPAYVMIDTGATHACISEAFVNNYHIPVDVVTDSVLCVNTPLGMVLF